MPRRLLLACVPALLLLAAGAQPTLAQQGITFTTDDGSGDRPYWVVLLALLAACLLAWPAMSLVDRLTKRRASSTVPERGLPERGVVLRSYRWLEDEDAT